MFYLKAEEQRGIYILAAKVLKNHVVKTYRLKPRSILLFLFILPYILKGKYDCENIDFPSCLL